MQDGYKFPFRVLFDELHSESWSISKARAELLQPENPGNSSYAAAAAELAKSGLIVASVSDSAAFGSELAACDVFVVVHPCGNDYEPALPGSPVFTAEEVKHIRKHLDGGGGLLLISEYEHNKYGSNLNEILEGSTICFLSKTATSKKHFGDQPAWVLPKVLDPFATHGITFGVSDICMYRSTLCKLGNADLPIAMPIELAPNSASASIVIGRHGTGRVACVGDSDLFGDEFLATRDHAALLRGLVWWLCGGGKLQSQRQQATRPDPKALALAAQVIEVVNDLRGMQSGPQGIVAADFGRAEEAVRTLQRLLQTDLPDSLRYQQGYFNKVCSDLGSWVSRGLDQPPHFFESIEELQLQRVRGAREFALVVGPMYLQNASTDYRFEAVLMRMPWPAWAEHLQAQFPDPTYVPGVLEAYSKGYHSACAVLFPEQWQTGAGKKPDDCFGVIFCDRESERLIRFTKHATQLYSAVLPPQLSAALDVPSVIQEGFILWDLTHNVAHFRGPGRYDWHKAKKRAPYWMHGLEELRVDLSAFASMHGIEQAFPLAAVGWKLIVLDRVLRFSIAGERSKNYDALAGQIVFQSLFRAGSNKLRRFKAVPPAIEIDGGQWRIDWDLVAKRLYILKEMIDSNEKACFEVSREAAWVKSHGLIASLVDCSPQSAIGRPASRARIEAKGAQALLDSVLDDEFPLGQILEHMRKSTSALR